MLYTRERALAKITKARPPSWPPLPPEPHEHRVAINIPYPPELENLDIIVWRMQRDPLARMHEFHVTDSGSALIGSIDYEPDLGETGIFDLHVISYDDILACDPFQQPTLDPEFIYDSFRMDNHLSVLARHLRENPYRPQLIFRVQPLADDEVTDDLGDSRISQCAAPTNPTRTHNNLLAHTRESAESARPCPCIACVVL